MLQLRNKVGRFLRILGLYNIVKWGLRIFWYLYSVLTSREQRVFNSYMRTHDTRGLHVGCGDNVLQEWLNTDRNPSVNRIYLDAVKKYPFPDNSFDYVFSEHMIEHISYADGRIMLSECFRVLKPGGTIRLATPDLQFLIGLYQDDQKKVHKDYIAWNAEMFIGNKAPHDAISVLNNYVRDWGHQYIYDVPALSRLMEDIGFTGIDKRELGESSHKKLQNLENKSRHPDGFLALESLVLEATKPAS